MGVREREGWGESKEGVEGEMRTSRQCSQSFKEGVCVAAAATTAAGGGGLVVEAEGHMPTCSQTCEEAVAARAAGGGGLVVKVGGSNERKGEEGRAKQQSEGFLEKNSGGAVAEITSSSSSSRRAGVGANNSLGVASVSQASTTSAQRNQLGQYISDLGPSGVAAAAAAGDCF